MGSTKHSGATRYIVKAVFGNGNYVVQKDFAGNPMEYTNYHTAVRAAQLFAGLFWSVVELEDYLMETDGN